MSVTSFLHLRETGGEFDIQKFGVEIAKKHPGEETMPLSPEAATEDIKAWLLRVGV